MIVNLWTSRSQDLQITLSKSLMAIFSIVPNITFSHFHRTECDYRLSFENGGIDCVNFPPSLPLWDAPGARWSNILITPRHIFEGYAGSLGFNRSRWRSFIVSIVWKSFLVVSCKRRLLCYTISLCLPYISLISESVDLYLQTNIIRKKRIIPGVVVWIRPTLVYLLPIAGMELSKPLLYEWWDVILVEFSV